jgi:hypothetical protein
VRPAREQRRNDSHDEQCRPHLGRVQMQPNGFGIGFFVTQGPEERDHAKAKACHRERRPNPGKRRSVEGELGPKVRHSRSVASQLHPGVIGLGRLLAHGNVLGKVRRAKLIMSGSGYVSRLAQAEDSYRPTGKVRNGPPVGSCAPKSTRAS